MKVAISFLMISMSIALCSKAYGQYSSSTRLDPNGNYTITATITNGFPGTSIVITGRPYSGEEMAETTQILADGTRVTHPRASVRNWRDSAGRTRTERPLMMTAGSLTIENMPYMTEVFDPIAGYRYYIEPVNRIAHRLKLPDNLIRAQLPPQNAAIGTVRTVSGPRPGPNNSEVTNESLGTKVIDGIPANGSRTTTTYPIGAMGNDRPIVTTRETWLSPDLNVMLFSKTVDPRSGESIQGLINVSRAEPAPSLFEVPSDYKLVDETGSFTITVTGHQVISFR
jgi:hypothetical protein